MEWNLDKDYTCSMHFTAGCDCRRRKCCYRRRSDGEIERRRWRRNRKNEWVCLPGL